MREARELEPITDKIAEPAKQWRNRYRALHPLTHVQVGIFRATGDEYWGYCTWPSKDVAEEKARASIFQNVIQNGHPIKAWLGAFPVIHA